MTPREVILANVTQDQPDRIGLTFDRHRHNDVFGAGLSASKTYTQRRWQEGAKEYYDDPWGNIWVRMAEGCAKGEIHKPVLEDWSQLDNLQLPDFDDPERFEGARRTFAEDAGDRFKLFFVPGWVFDTSRYLRKMEIYFMDLIEYPEQIERLHEKVTSLYERVIDQAGQAGADGVFFCEDLGTQDRVLIGPEMWRRVFRPHYERLTSAAHRHGMKVMMHSCGYNWELLDDLAGAGINCFQFDQPRAYDIDALAAKLRELKVGLWSPLDIQRVMPTGDRERIEAEARTMVETFGGGLIAKNYPDLPGIGVKEQWDDWAYQALLEADRITDLPV